MRLNTSIEDIPNGTNILDIEVPDELRKRVKTGIVYFDDALGGRGLTPSMVTLFTGTPGAGKTTMMLELANSLTGNGGNVLFNTGDELRAAQPDKPFVLVIDSLQTLNDGKYGEHNVNNKTAERSLLMITEYCKSTFANAIVIGQVTKDGKMAGANVLKHMVDALITLDVERKDDDLMGCRILQTEKNRFGGAAHTFWLAIRERGFQEISRMSVT